jgi:hypothetical protein
MERGCKGQVTVGQNARDSDYNGLYSGLGARWVRQKCPTLADTGSRSTVTHGLTQLELISFSLIQGLVVLLHPIKDSDQMIAKECEVNDFTWQVLIGCN